MLSKKFSDLSAYRSTEHEGYKLLPFRFSALDDHRYVISNMVGEYRVVTRDEVDSIINHKVIPGSDFYDELKSNHFIYDYDSDAAIKLLAIKYKTKLNRIAQFTALHIFVATLRCDYSCPYCQVSRQTEDKQSFDMTEEIADQSLDLVFKSPNKNIKIEFQGGEPLLNWPIVKYVVEKAEALNQSFKRNLQFVIATNLTFLDEERIDYCKKHRIHISTSLDGPARLHNKNRPRPGKNGHQLVIDAIKSVKQTLGRERVSALMTTTLESMEAPREIIDEYIKCGFNEIFLRPLSPYGFAVHTGQINKYTISKWLEFYKKGLEYIIEVNKQGYPMREIYSSIVLKKMLTSQDPGYVDLQSPSGAGISAVVYNYDGDVYASDEARMLAETGDKALRLGNVFENTYEEIFGSDHLMDAIEQSVAISSPICQDCAFVPYCGSDPTYHYATQKDFNGNKAISSFCQKNIGVFRHLISIMEDNPEAKKIITNWI